MFTPQEEKMQNLETYTVTDFLAVIRSIVITSIAIAFMAITSGRADAADADAAYDRVMKSGKIRAGYCVYYPLLMKDPKTKKFSGIGFDTLDLIAKHLGLKLELTEEVSFGIMIEGLKTNRYDMLACPVWPNAIRARSADFSHPISFSTVCAYTKYGDKRLDSSLKNLNSP